MSVVGYMAEDLSSENESGVGHHQQNKSTVLKTFYVLSAMV